MIRDGKRFYVIFINDNSIFTKIYLLRTKDEVLEVFVKNKIENNVSLTCYTSNCEISWLRCYLNPK